MYTYVEYHNGNEIARSASLKLNLWYEYLKLKKITENILLFRFRLSRNFLQNNNTYNIYDTFLYIFT